MSINPSQESNKINQEVQRLLDTVKNEKKFENDSKKLNNTKETLKRLYTDVTGRIRHYDEKIAKIKNETKPAEIKEAELISSNHKLKTQEENLEKLKKINDIISKLEKTLPSTTTGNPSTTSDKINKAVKEVITESKKYIDKNDYDKLIFTRTKIENLVEKVREQIIYYETKIPKIPQQSDKDGNTNKLNTQKDNLALLANQLENINRKLAFKPTQVDDQALKPTINGLDLHPSSEADALNNRVNVLVTRAKDCSKDNYLFLSNQIHKLVDEIKGKKNAYPKKPDTSKPTITKHNKLDENLTKLYNTLTELSNKFTPEVKAVKETFLNTSGSAKIAKFDKNNVGAHILGVFEAIGRAVLTPFVAIYLFIASGNHDFTSTMKSYFETIKKSITLLE